MQSGRQQGSVLIMVLWILLLVSVLAGRCLVHNRGKAVAAAYGWEALCRQQACLSLQELFQAGRPFAGAPAAGDNWLALTVGRRAVRVRFGAETAKRLNLNKIGEEQLRSFFHAALGEEHLEQADVITDSLLDWRDANDLVRANGAEDQFYAAEGLDYQPANGPFKLLSEMLLVRGVTPELFWGRAPAAAEIVKPGSTAATGQDGGQDDVDRQEATGEKLPLVNAFTIRGKNVKRLEVFFPRDDGGGEDFIFILQAAGRQWRQLAAYHGYLPAPAGGDDTGP